MEHSRRSLEKRTAAVAPRPYHRGCIDGDHRGLKEVRGGGCGGGVSLGSSRVISLHQQNPIKKGLIVETHAPISSALPVWMRLRIFYQTRGQLPPRLPGSPVTGASLQSRRGKTPLPQRAFPRPLRCRELTNQTHNQKQGEPENSYHTRW